MGRILIAGLLLVLGFPILALAAEKTTVQKKKTVEETVTIDMRRGRSIQPVAKLSEITGAEIARVLFESAAIKAKPDDSVVGISKWSGPLRVSIQDVDGRDLDLSVSPGSDIVKYLADLANSAQILLTMTSVAKQNNNVSIVISSTKLSMEAIKQLDGHVGAIMGAHEFDDHTRLARSIFSMPSVWTIGYMNALSDGGLGGYWGVARVGYDIRGCIMILEDNLTWHPEYVIEVLAPASNDCLGLSRRHPKQFAADFLLRSHSGEFLSLLYNKAVKSGMDKPTAERIFKDLAGRIL